MEDKKQDIYLNFDELEAEVLEPTIDDLNEFFNKEEKENA